MSRDADDLAMVADFLRTRSERSFRQLYAQHTPAMFLLALRLTGGKQATAEDAVQDAWIRIVRLLPKFRGASALRTWLCGFVVNCCRELTRHEGAVAARDADDSPTSVPALAEAIDLENAVRSLPAGCREVLVLHDIEGYRHDEIADLLEIAQGTSRHQLFRARQLLRHRLTSGRVIE